MREFSFIFLHTKKSCPVIMTNLYVARKVDSINKVTIGGKVRTIEQVMIVHNQPSRRRQLYIYYKLSDIR